MLSTPVLAVITIDVINETLLSLNLHLKIEIFTPLQLVLV